MMIILSKLLMIKATLIGCKLTIVKHRSMSRDVRASVAREFESATRDIPGVALRPAEDAAPAQ